MNDEEEIYPAHMQGKTTVAPAAVNCNNKHRMRRRTLVTFEGKLHDHNKAHTYLVLKR